MYSYREAVPLGTTGLTKDEVDAAIAALKPAWTGESYHLLTRNCVTFCEALAAALGCGPVPAWVNALAGGASAASEAAASAVAVAKGAGARAKDASVRVVEAARAALAAAAQGSGGGGGSANGGE